MDGFEASARPEAASVYGSAGFARGRGVSDTEQVVFGAHSPISNVL
jgi:hypothetical protein